MDVKHRITRNNFLKKIGFTGASLFAIYSLESCLNEGNITPSGPFTIDLSNATYAKLKTIGEFVVVNSVVVANNNGTYIAATLRCSHEGLNQITFNNQEWFCTAHGARFNAVGKGLNSNGSKGLTVFKTSIVGDILTINA